ncbi:hypothetical protein SEA_FEYRE_53 [Mycobacterium phage Feyre]|nr:hypothetical protein SEA_WATERFOUL_53 [Mycobacterium phage Waterfoul]QXN73795.1 hypothetical protein SEA_SOSEPH_52 [Mycobacterium phage SoSeph]WNM65522.1 hypothetical protein SEA_HEFTYBOY_52 [Mycobacterium phage Heftyboy]
MRVTRRNETVIVFEENDSVRDLYGVLAKLPNGAKVRANTMFGAAGIVVDHMSTE